jgi:hypothetical protein
MEKKIFIRLISRWDKDGFEEDLINQVQSIAPEDLIDIKLSTAIASNKVNYSALVIYKGSK